MKSIPVLRVDALEEVGEGQVPVLGGRGLLDGLPVRELPRGLHGVLVHLLLGLGVPLDEALHGGSEPSFDYAANTRIHTSPRLLP